MLTIYLLLFFTGILAGEVLSPIYKETIISQYQLSLIDNSFDNIVNVSKQHFEVCSIYVSIKLIYLYSRIQILWNKTVRFMSPFLKLINNRIRFCLEKYKLIKETKEASSDLITKINFYKNGIELSMFLSSRKCEELTSQYITDIVDKEKHILSDYELIVITSWFNKTEKGLNDVSCQDILCYCIESIPSVITQEVSNIRFISLQLHYLDKNLDIKLQTDDYSFYMVGNTLNKSFFTYFIQNKMNEKNKNEYHDIANSEYKITLIDQNVNILELNKTDIIIIYKNDYKIMRNDNDNYEKTYVNRDDKVEEDTDDYINLDTET